GLRGLEVAIGGFSRITSRVDLGLGTLALCNIAVNENKASIWHCVPADLYHAPIWPDALCLEFLFRIFETAVEFCLNVIGSKFSALREDTEIIGIARSFDQCHVRQVNHFLDI